MSTTNTNLGQSKDQQAITKVKADITAQVLAKVASFQQSGELRLPDNYSPENALKSAYLILLETKNKDGKYALEHCTQTSIANALLKMVVWGLSPLKKQCDLIMYGDKLECGIEYTGNIVLAKRYGGMKEIKANAIVKGDVFEFQVDTETGRRKVTKHEQSLENMGSKEIIGAYAIITMNDGTTDCEIMNFAQIKQAWQQGATKGESPAHRNFPDQMSIKTVINRACKLLIRGSDDAVLYEKEDSENEYSFEDGVNKNIAANANKKVLDFNNANIEDANIVDETTLKEEPESPKETKLPTTKEEIKALF